jgi:hypothetical protein
LAEHPPRGGTDGGQHSGWRISELRSKDEHVFAAGAWVAGHQGAAGVAADGGAAAVVDGQAGSSSSAELPVCHDPSRAPVAENFIAKTSAIPRLVTPSATLPSVMPAM